MTTTRNVTSLGHLLEKAYIKATENGHKIDSWAISFGKSNIIATAVCPKCHNVVAVNTTPNHKAGENYLTGEALEIYCCK